MDQFKRMFNQYKFQVVVLAVIGLAVGALITLAGKLPESIADFLNNLIPPSKPKATGSK